MKYSIIAILIVFLAVAGCQQPIADSQLITVDMTGGLNTMSLYLNDYVTDLKVTRLETNDNAIISYFSGYVGEKYIISVEREKVLLFKSDGAFICTIAKEGKGPGEYTQIDAWTVDENENSFLFHDIGKDFIYHYNLSNQQEAENIPFNDNGYLSEMILLNDSVLSILPNRFSDYGYLFFYQTTTGQITGGIAKENVPHPGAWAGRSSVFKQRYDHSIMFQPSESDTVFRVQGTEMSPEYVLLVDEPQKSGEKTKGTSAYYLHKDENLLLIASRRFESLIGPNSQSITTYRPDYIVVDLKTLTTSLVDKFSLEVMGLKIEDGYLSFPSKDQLVIVCQAMDFKDIIDEAIKSEEVTGNHKESLIQLKNEISDYDNPIIITGKWK